MPPSPWTVSTITAADLSGPPPRLASSRSSHPKSGTGPSRAWSNGIGVAWVSGTPAPPRWNGLPVTDSAPSVMPWKALVKVITSVRPVTLRASFSAASTALAPPGPGNCTR